MSDPCDCQGACYGTYQHKADSGILFYYGCGPHGLIQADSQQMCVGKLESPNSAAIFKQNFRPTSQLCQ